ncbi:MAG: MBL fold metallo-hydrolase [Rhodococcus sp. (in: high G+C Gram-positive bacteria)]|jgi:glyoxylase-like metal-dependent hydrolase (beta-lactamase superfamily II)|uniref:MBL fold metallo-hydrolase n=1 Tax=Rhodococcoides yunnanense TaxID=278209 RepID=UPI0022B20D55|nr:MBL fold metallo-hydrolase [Rhodococcus yunnanensis]MCZ4278766.1 MBL fold metallo-hydrolase [Rhodococcus yunnanensis]
MTTSPKFGGILGTVDVPVMGLPVSTTRVYVIDGLQGPILVDAGWDDEAAWQVLSNGLMSLGLNISDTEGVLLTHHHPDHSGLAGRIQAASGAWVAMHSIDAELMDEMRSTASLDSHLSWELENLASAGAPPAALEKYAHDGGSYSMAVPSATVDRHLSDGEAIKTAAGDLTCLWLPGHTHGHMGALMEKHQMVFTGDHVLSKTSPHVGEFVFPIDEHRLLKHYLGSLQIVQNLVRAGYTLHPAHENSDINWDRRIDELTSHHHHRLDNLRSVLADDTPRTLWELAEQMTWAIPWVEIPPLGWQLALSECSAHVSYLLDTAHVTTVTANGRPLTFTTSSK